MIEAREYGPDSTDGEQQLLRSRVKLIADDVVLYEEVPVQSTYQIDVMFERLRELTRDLNKFFYVISLRDAGRPTINTRHHLKMRFLEFHERITHTAVYTGKNFMLNVAIKFVFNGFGFDSYSVHRTVEQAMHEIDGIRKRR